MDRHRRAHDGLGQRPLDLRTGGGSTGVQDPRHGVTPFACQLEPAVRIPVEHRPERHQLLDTAGALLYQHPHRLGVAETRTRGERVGQV